MEMRFPKQFIKATNAVCDYDSHVPAPLFRKVFQITKPATNAELIICGLGFYELYVNGHHVTKGALAPYISNPDDILYYDWYEITEYLRLGENVIGVILGNGFMNPFGGRIWSFEEAAWRGPLRMALELQWCEDGENHMLQSDETFRVSSSPITFDELRIGTFYDANLEKKGWNCSGYDDSAWENASLVDAPLGEPRLCTVEPVTVYREIRPVKISYYDDFCFCCKENISYTDPIEQTRVKNTYLYDFGENNAGVCRLKIKGKKGQTVKLRFGDLLVDGYFTVSDTIFIRSTATYYFDYPQMDVYTLKGDGEETFVPPFIYHGFRYVLVEGITEEQATEDLLTYLVMSSAVNERCEFSCSDETLNQLFAMTKRSDRSNLMYIPTDCPHREKNGWTADAALSAEHMLLMMTAENSFREWLVGIRKAQRTDGALPGIIPTAGWGFDWGNGPGWDCVCVYLPYFCYQYTGDKNILRENAEMIFRYLQYASGKRDARGLVEFGLGDWLQPAHSEEEPDCPLCVSDSMMLLDISVKAMKLFEIVENNSYEAFASSLATELRSAIRKHLINFDTMVVYGNCQTAQCLALAFHVFESDEENAALKQLLRLIHEANDHMACGVLGGRHIFRVLLEFGEVDLAYKMIVGPGFPSYGEWILDGATTLRESFRRPDEKKDSGNHHFWGDIAAVFIQYFVGLKVNPYLTDTNEFEISPVFPETLDYAKAIYTIKDGEQLSVFWQRVDEKIKLVLQVPKCMHGQLKVPSGWCLEEEKTAGTITDTVYVFAKSVT